MASQKQSGKAFEFAVVKALAERLGPGGHELVLNSSLQTAQADFFALAPEKQSEHVASVKPAIDLISRFEPHLKLAIEGKQAVKISLQADGAGGAGDVRDLLLQIPSANWEIGISAKHQHEALKHSRLSRKIDFGEKWFGLKCTDDYFAAIGPVFDLLEQSKSQGKLWSELPSKEELVYIPLLQHFRDEVLRLERQSPNTVARNLVAYLIGLKDFYKVIKLKHETKVQVFNFNGTLNLPAGGKNPETKLEKLKLPTRVVELDFKREGDGTSATTLEMICDGGWQLSFRLHNASSKVEGSLKFDINLVGRPNNLQTSSVFW